MNSGLILTISVLSVITMLYALWLVLSLKKRVSGGVVGHSLKILAGLVFLFAAGYVAMPFLGRIPPEDLQLVVNIIFLFGAIYVVLTITLIRRIILSLSE